MGYIGDSRGHDGGKIYIKGRIALDTRTWSAGPLCMQLCARIGGVNFWGGEARGNNFSREGGNVSVVVHWGPKERAASMGRLVEEVQRVTAAEEIRRPAWVTVGFGEPVLRSVRRL